MKKIYLFFLTFGLALSISAQLPNPGFENWTIVGSFETPDFWGNMNASTSGSGVYTITKGVSGPASGAAFVKLMTKDVAGTITPGIIVSGMLDEATLKPKSGIPFTGRPEKLKGKWQFMGYGTDVATFSGWLTKWNTSVHQRDTIAILSGNTSGMLHSWGDFNFPFTYRSAAIPDSVVIMISSSSSNPVKNSFIWLDDLAFDGTVTSVEPVNTKIEVNVFPNPASQFVKVSFYSPKDDQVNFILNDNIGNRVAEYQFDVAQGSNTVMIDLSSARIHNGLYFLSMHASFAAQTRKLVIKK
ncbi:MAG: T9SS type A sorting domain-containing protein [Bacteroidales bacterium]|nr:T9SS type A sorting domain-containing protein [Bacteroidales bacterium]